MSSSKRKKILIGVALGGHTAALLLLWYILKEDNIQQPVFEKVISASFTTEVPSNLPLLSKTERVQAEKERRKNEESEWSQQQSALKQKYEAEKKEAEAKKAAEEKKKLEDKKKETVKKETPKKDDSKKKLEDKKKKEELKKQQEMADRKAAEDKKRLDKERADRKKREEAAAAQRAAAEAERQANAQRQVVLGKHVTSDIENRLRFEWNKGITSAIQFNDPNDAVEIEFIIARDGRVLQAKVTRHAKSANLNSKAATLIKTISASNYRFPAFPAQYNQNTMKITRPFRTDSN